MLSRPGSLGSCCSVGDSVTARSFGHSDFSQRELCFGHCGRMWREQGASGERRRPSATSMCISVPVRQAARPTTGPSEHRSARPTAGPTDRPAAGPPDTRTAGLTALPHRTDGGTPDRGTERPTAGPPGRRTDRVGPTASDRPRRTGRPPGARPPAAPGGVAVHRDRGAPRPGAPHRGHDVGGLLLRHQGPRRLCGPASHAAGLGGVCRFLFCGAPQVVLERRCSFSVRCAFGGSSQVAPDTQVIGQGWSPRCFIGIPPEIGHSGLGFWRLCILLAAMCSDLVVAGAQSTKGQAPRGDMEQAIQTRLVK